MIDDSGILMDDEKISAAATSAAPQQTAIQPAPPSVEVKNSTDPATSDKQSETVVEESAKSESASEAKIYTLSQVDELLKQESERLQRDVEHYRKVSEERWGECSKLVMQLTQPIQHLVCLHQ